MKAIRTNPFNLSNREIEVLDQISLGNTLKEIACQLYLSAHTIHSHRKNLLSKTGAKNSAQMIRIAFENGLLNNNNSISKYL